jgi:hypothetical protein
MDHYHIWCSLKDSREDLAWCSAVGRYMQHLQNEGLIHSWSLQRRKLGFGPEELGEFHIDITVRDMAQLEEAFSTVAVRAGEVEELHHKVYSAVTGFRSALYRDFPDAVRADREGRE